MGEARERIDDTMQAKVPEECMVEVAMEVVGGKWKLALLKLLLTGTHRFSELQRALPSITARMLTRQLRELEQAGLLHREVHPEIPPCVEYSLTPVGRSLERIIGNLDDWGRWYRQQGAKA